MCHPAGGEFIKRVSHFVFRARMSHNHPHMHIAAQYNNTVDLVIPDKLKESLSAPVEPLLSDWVVIRKELSSLR